MDVVVKQGVLNVSNLEAFLSEYGESAVFLNAGYIVDEDHAYFAAKKAIKAWIERRSVARTLPLEVILYAAATRQINKATTIGIKEGTNDVVIIFLGKKKVDEKKLRIKDFEEKEVLKMDRKKFERIIQFFSINKNELEIVGKEKISLLVRERIVLFDLNK